MLTIFPRVQRLFDPDRAPCFLSTIFYMKSVNSKEELSAAFTLRTIFQQSALR